jgi:hypothetical protein
MGDISKAQEARLKDMQAAITNFDNSKRAALASALVAEEFTRNEQIQRARDYVIACEEEKNEISVWLWHVLFFFLGFIACMMIPAFSEFFWDMKGTDGCAIS